MINGIAWVKRTGSPWRDMPERYGPWKTAHLRFRRWAEDGTRARLKAHVMALAEADDDIDRNAAAGVSGTNQRRWTGGVHVVVSVVGLRGRSPCDRWG